MTTPIQRTFARAATARIYGRTRLPPWTIAAALTLLALVLYLAVEAATGRIPRLLGSESPESVGCTWLIGDYRISIVGILLLGYVTAAQVYLRRWTKQNLLAVRRQLSPATRSENEFAADAGFGDWAWSAAGVAGIGICLLVAIDIADRPFEWTSAYWIWPHVFNWVWSLLFGWLGGRFLFGVVAHCVHFSRAASELGPIDLFDTQSTAPFIDQGTKSSLLLLIFVGIVCVHLTDVGSGAVTVAVAGFLLILASSVSLIPMLGHHRIVHRAKHTALDRVRAGIRSHGLHLYGDGEATPRPSQDLADLVTMEKRLEEVSEWLISISGAARLVLYVAIGLGSWFGAAMVERALDRWLG